MVQWELMEKNKIRGRKGPHVCIFGMTSVREARGTVRAGARIKQDLPLRLSRGYSIPVYFHNGPLLLTVLIWEKSCKNNQKRHSPPWVNLLHFGVSLGWGWGGGVVWEGSCCTRWMRFSALYKGNWGHLFLLCFLLNSVSVGLKNRLWWSWLSLADVNYFPVTIPGPCMSRLSRFPNLPIN